MQVLASVFWGLVTLSVLVFIHEGGHYLAARACGMRVTEFYLGLPCRWKLYHKSRDHGTEVGVTPVLLGGYTRICGMEGTQSDLLAAALMCVQRHGRVRVEDLAEEVGCDTEAAYELMATLADWASVEPYYDEAAGERPGQRDWPAAFQTVRRDHALLTEYDRQSDFDLPGVTPAGEPRVPDMTADQFLAHERAQTYCGQGFWHRVLTLACGPLVNLLFAFVLFVGSLSIAGMDVAVNQNRIGSVVSGSVAELSGLQAGDVVTAVGDTTVDDWQSLVVALRTSLDSGEDFTLTVERGGTSQLVDVLQGGEAHDTLGITAPTQHVRLSVPQACAAGLSYAGAVAQAAVQLIVPSQTMTVLEGSTSVVGISAMAAEAVESGIVTYVLFAAAISMSLGFMNLLPIPPLDGGKILIEIVQAALRRPLSVRVQNAISYAGLAFFLFVFVFVLRNDIMRFVVR